MVTLGQQLQSSQISQQSRFLNRTARLRQETANRKTREENARKQAEYQAQLEEYNRQKAEYDAQVEEYERQQKTAREWKEAYELTAKGVPVQGNSSLSDKMRQIYSGQRIGGTIVEGKRVGAERIDPSSVYTGMAMDYQYATEMKKYWADKKEYQESLAKFQLENPAEKLNFDSKGNVISVESKAFDGKYTLSEYQKKVDEENRYQEALGYTAKNLKEYYGKNVNLDAPEQSWLGKLWTGIKTLSYASPSGYKKEGFSETALKDITGGAVGQGVRYKQVLSIVPTEIVVGDPIKFSLPYQSKGTSLYSTEKGFYTPKITAPTTQLKLVNPPSPLEFFPPYKAYQIATKFYTLPYNTAYNLVEGQRKLDYKAQESQKFIEQMEKLEVSNSPELQPYLEQEKLNLLKERGLGMTTETKDGQTITTITDPAFDRRVSEFGLEYEMQIKDKDVLGQTASLLKYSGITAGEQYLLWKGLGYAFKGAKYVYNIAGGQKLSNALSKTLNLNLVNVQRTGSFSGTGLLTTKQVIKQASGFALVSRVPSNVWTGTKVLKLAFGGAVIGAIGYGKYKEYQSNVDIYGKPMAISTLVAGTTGELLGIETATGLLSQSYGKARSWITSTKTLKEPDFSQKGFWSKHENRRVYMEHYKGLDFESPRSWLKSAQGYKKGQFVRRLKKFMPDEVTAQLKYGGDVEVYNEGGTKLIKTVRTPDIWELQKTSRLKTNIFKIGDTYAYRVRNVKTGKFKIIDLINEKQLTQLDPKIIQSIRGENFPLDKTTTHLRWFKIRNVQEFGLPALRKLPVNVKGMAMGYSATPTAWKGTNYGEQLFTYGDKSIILKGFPQYYSGKGVSGYFTGLFGGGREEGVKRMVTSPTISTLYSNKVRVNKAVKEVRGMIGKREVKSYILSKSTEAGEFNIPIAKREVEAEVFVDKRIPIRKAFAVNWEGWKVPFEEQLMGGKSELSKRTIKKIMQNMGSVKEITSSEITGSYIPVRASEYVASSSLIKSPKYYPSSKSYTNSSSAMSSIMSKISKMSSSKRSSRVSSAVSRALSYPYSPSSPSYSSITRSYPPSKPPRSNISRLPYLPSSLKSKIKSKLKYKKYPEFLGLLPDFTTRAIGLEPDIFKDVKASERAMARIQTGFEVRRGGRLQKGFKMGKGDKVWGSNVKKVGDMDIDLKGIMK